MKNVRKSNYYVLVCFRCVGKPYIAYEGVSKSYGKKVAFEILAHIPNVRSILLFCNSLYESCFYLDKGKIVCKK